MRFGLVAWSLEIEDWHWRMSSLTKCLVKGWVFLKCGNFVNSCKAERRLVCSPDPGLMRSFQFPGCSCHRLRAVFTIGSDASRHSILVISKWLLVAGRCQRHLMFNSNVIEINKSVQDIDVWHLVKSPKVLVQIIQKIVQALVFSLIQRPGYFKSSKEVGEIFCSDCYGKKDYREWILSNPQSDL